MKRNATEWGKLSVSSMSYREFKSGTHRKEKKLQILIKINKPIKLGYETMGLNKEFSKEEIQMTDSFFKVSNVHSYYGNMILSHFRHNRKQEKKEH